MKRRTVGELMNPDVVTLAPDQRARDALVLLAQRGVGAAPVVDGAGHVLGVVSQSDLVRHDARTQKAAESGFFSSSIEDYADLAEVLVPTASLPVSEVMTKSVAQVSPDTGVAFAANVMRERRIHRLFVTERGILVGVLTTFDLLRVVEELC